jgi:MFS family permease
VVGAEWPAGAALAMETWPVRSRGFMGGVLQGSWGLGFMLSSALYGLCYSYIGWRGMLWVGVLPALSVFYVRKFVKEPPIWLENRRRQRVEQREVRAPLVSSFELHGAAALGAPRNVTTENLTLQYLYWIGRKQHGNIIPISSGEFEQRYVLAD